MNEQQIRDQIAQYEAIFRASQPVIDAQVASSPHASGRRHDAVGFATTLARDLVSRSQRIREEVFAPTEEWREQIPRDPEQHSPGADFIDLPRARYAARAEPVGNMSMDWPMAAFGIAEDRLNATWAGLGYKYSWMDSIRDAYTGRNSQERLTRAVVQGHRRWASDVFTAGIPGLGLVGFHNHFAPTILALPTGTWATATPDQIIDDVIAMQRTVDLETEGNFPANTLALPASRWHSLSRRLTDGAGNIRAFIEGLGMTILKSFELETAGPGGVPRAICYRRDPDVVSYHQPQDVEAMAPDVSALGTTYRWRQKAAGVAVHQPRAIVYGEGI